MARALPYNCQPCKPQQDVLNSNLTIHASAVLAGARALLIRGPAGSGKSQLTLRLLQSVSSGRMRWARLVADDRVQLEGANGRLVVRTPPAIAGLLEVRGIGIRELPYEPVAVASLVVDLHAQDADRMPAAAAMEVTIAGVRLPRLAVAAGDDPFPTVMAAITLGGHLDAERGDDNTV